MPWQQGPRSLRDFNVIKDFLMLTQKWEAFINLLKRKVHVHVADLLLYRDFSLYGPFRNCSLWRQHRSSYLGTPCILLKGIDEIIPWIPNRGIKASWSGRIRLVIYSGSLLDGLMSPARYQTYRVQEVSRRAKSSWQAVLITWCWSLAIEALSETKKSIT